MLIEQQSPSLVALSKEFFFVTLTTHPDTSVLPMFWTLFSNTVRKQTYILFLTRSTHCQHLALWKVKRPAWHITLSHLPLNSSLFYLGIWMRLEYRALEFIYSTVSAKTLEVVVSDWYDTSAVAIR